MSSGGNFIEDALNIVTQVGTGGLIGIENGKIGAGVTSKTAFKGIKDITGASAAEDANKAAEKQFKEQQAAALADNKAKQNAFAQQQLQKSKMAGGARSSSVSKPAGGALKSKPSSNLGSQEQDFLGL